MFLLSRKMKPSLLRTVVPLINDVGGKVDALEITSDGKVAWKQKKYNCPEHSD